MQNLSHINVLFLFDFLYLADTFLHPLQTFAHSGRSVHMWGGNVSLQPTDKNRHITFKFKLLNNGRIKTIGQ